MSRACDARPNVRHMELPHSHGRLVTGGPNVRVQRLPKAVRWNAGLGFFDIVSAFDLRKALLA